MEILKRFSILIAGVLILTSAVIPRPSHTEDNPIRTRKDSVSYLLGVYLGGIMLDNHFATDLNQARMKEGLNDILSGRQLKIEREEINDVFNSYLEGRMVEIGNANARREEEFFNGLRKKGIAGKESGLFYKIIKPGDSVRPSVTDSVSVTYTLKDLDGTIMDEQTEDPLNIRLENSIAGFKEGMTLIGQGGEIILYIPYKLGYGDKCMGKILPCQTLIFDVSLKKVN